VSLLVAGGLSLALGDAAYAAPPPAPTAVTITGDGIVKALTVRAEADRTLFNAMLDQVDWLTGAGQTSSPSPGDLGPKYTIVVLVDDAPKRSYDLYPLAKGGPRAFRPAKQPDQRNASPAWFFGRLSMSETLRAAGVPLPEQRDVMTGGIGGGERVIPDKALNPGKDLNDLLGELRQLMLLNAGVIIMITLGLAGISLLVRRRTR
jgi:hypothetical protein